MSNIITEIDIEQERIASIERMHTDRIALDRERLNLERDRLVFDMNRFDINRTDNKEIQCQ